MQSLAKPQHIRCAYLWHGRLSLEPSPHTIVDSLRPPPVGRNTFETVTLMAVELVGSCNRLESAPASHRLAERPISDIRKFHQYCQNGSGCEGLSRTKLGTVNVRFFTIGTCFFADTICVTVSESTIRLASEISASWMRCSLPCTLST